MKRENPGQDDVLRLSKTHATALPKINHHETVVRNSSNDSTMGEFNPEQEQTEQITGVDKLTISIDREVYLQHLRDLQTEQGNLILKNGILQRRLAEYYRKRKLEHALKDIKPVEGDEMTEKYTRKLLAYFDLKEKGNTEMAEIQSNTEEGEELHAEHLSDAANKFQEFQQLEKSTGLGLIYFNKGKPIADKTVERLLHLQRRKTEQTSALRLRYIRARNAVNELEATMRRLETLAPGLTVAHYNQLLIDNQNFSDKIEERDDDLIKNRTKVTEHNQMLAHIREKMNHTNELIDSTECDLGDAEMDWLNAREKLNEVKSRRDSLRIQLNVEHQKAGLLTRRDLLDDYEAATEEVALLKLRKVQLEDSIARRSKELRAAREALRTSREDASLFAMNLSPHALPPPPLPHRNVTSDGSTLPLTNLLVDC